MSAGQNRTASAVVNEETRQVPEVSTIDAIFLNRKPLEVRYYIKDNGTEELIMIDVETVQPIFADYCPRTTANAFESLDNLASYARENIHLDKCWDYEYADCICNLISGRVVPPLTKVQMLPPSGCRRHFHHSCSSCVNSWLLEYLRMIILHRESKSAFEIAAEEIICRVFIGDVYEKYANVIKKQCSEFYLWIAQRWTLKGYLRRDIINSWL
ncbi:repeat element protein-e2.2 [Ichnoviriform fugitivi]|uniref:Repeat element protein-e2.2 n=1 Tax=Ichnoviriform fugitivi TaxID=265522 RepID=A2Q0P2_9VIRU|nr:repeat element protein-e2.2 [Ichnoviriform fugitivi]BAF45757.1 repeat element protein-e2.2 [Ichnoviriform fugitivi]